MQTNITPDILNTAIGKRADEILRKCVHCGFCTATCPTYQLLGDELDGPRGRIYQIKLLLEGEPAERETQNHLDRCLTCRSCETTCPSGVDYVELVDIGRNHLEQQNLRPKTERLIRYLLGALLPYKKRHYLLFKFASKLRFLLPLSLRAKAPVIRALKTYHQKTESASEKTVLLLDGCLQSTLSPNTNAAAESLLKALGYRVIRETSQSCCGAVNQHLGQNEQAKQWVLHNLEHWQQLDQSQDLHAIVSTATGCGIMLREYSHIIQQLPQQSETFQSVLNKIKDISELFDAGSLQKNLKTFKASQKSVAYHAPCTLTHGHKLADRLAQQLTAAGYQLEMPQDAHLCCGSAGTYSLLQPELSVQLRDNKLQALQASTPDIIISANVGCEHHLNSASSVPVLHWVELIADDIEVSSSA